MTTPSTQRRFHVLTINVFSLLSVFSRLFWSAHLRGKEEVALRSDLFSSIGEFNILVLTRIGAIGQSGAVE